jgi:hypothetical protein
MLAPGGWFAAEVRGSGHDVPMRAIVGSVILSELGMSRPSPSPGIDLADPGQFDRVFSEAGSESISGASHSGRCRCR